MKLFTILFSTSLLLACNPKQNETSAQAQKPEQQKQTPASANTVTPNLIGHYAGWLAPTSSTPGYGVISINRTDKKTQMVSVSTLFFGVRTNYKIPYQLVQQKLKVNTKRFNFSLTENLVKVDLIDGISQTRTVEMTKLNTFNFDASKTINLNKAARRYFGRQIISRRQKNASAVSLQSSDVENLYRTDLEIMRNGIYARRGGAFEDGQMTSFFSKNDWYTPIFTIDEVQKKLTVIELKNIALLTRYEKHAKLHYGKIRR